MALTTLTKIGKGITSLFKAKGATHARGLEDRFSDVTNVKDYGIVGDGVSDDSDALITMMGLKSNIYIDADTVVRVTKDIILPVSLESIYGSGKILLDGDVARIRTSSNVGTPIKVVNNLSFSNNTYQLNLGGDYTGHYMYLDNALPWFVSVAGSPSTPSNSMNPFSYTADDNDFKTERKGVYRISSYDSSTGLSTLSLPTNFNAISGTATIYEKVHTLNIKDITIEHINWSQVKEAVSLRISGGYGVSIDGCRFISCRGLQYYWLNTKCSITNCYIDVGGGVWLSTNTRQCNISNNRIEHRHHSDGAIVLYYNACENVISGNTITSFINSGDLVKKWGVITHSCSDYNTISGNVITSTSGVSDFMTNKGNIFTGNTINGQDSTFSFYCFSTFMIGNLFNDSKQFSISGSKYVELKNNQIIQATDSPYDNLIPTYDSASKPFGFEGFIAQTADTLDITGNFIIGKGIKTNARNYISSSGGKNTFNMDSYEDSANYCIGNRLSKVLNVNVRNNTIKNFDAGILNYHNLIAGTSTDYKTRGNKYEDCNVGIVQASATTGQLKGISSIGDVYKNTKMCIISDGAWCYLKSAYCIEVESLMVIAGDKSNVMYAMIVDVDNIIENETLPFKHYDFSGRWSYYQTGVISSGKHSKASNIPYGAQYYQISDALNTKQDCLFINKVNSYVGGGNVTVKRTLNETWYSN